MNEFKHRLAPLLLLIVALGAPTGCLTAAGVTFFVAENGRDTWSGKRPQPNTAKTDGPFATPLRAQAEVRKLKAAGQLAEGATVFVRGGVCGRRMKDESCSAGG